jgi:hypothetical protein
MSLPCFTELRFLFYPAGIKSFPLELFDWINSIFLFHWICGDVFNIKSGWKKNNLEQYRIYIKKKFYGQNQNYNFTLHN